MSGGRWREVMVRGVAKRCGYGELNHFLGLVLSLGEEEGVCHLPISPQDGSKQCAHSSCAAS